MEIRTNNVPRDVIRDYELSESERAEFDYHDWQAIYRGEESAEFFRFKGQLYDLGEFIRIIPPGSKRVHPMECADPDFQGWDGYLSDSFFSGILVRWRRDECGIDSDQIIVGQYFA